MGFCQWAENGSKTGLLGAKIGQKCGFHPLLKRRFRRKGGSFSR